MVKSIKLNKKKSFFIKINLKNLKLIIILIVPVYFLILGNLLN
jgi:hypothetical protein